MSESEKHLSEEHLSEEQHISPDSTKWELHLVLKELRKMGNQINSELNLNSRVWEIHNALLRYKTGFQVAIISVIIVWTVFGATTFTKLESVTDLIEKITFLEYRVKVLEIKLNKEK